jgi:predicted phosphodiesterase
MLRLEDAWIYVIHDIAQLDIEPRAAGVNAIVAGHSHKPASTIADSVVYVNPGSAGPRRFKLPISIGFLHVAGSSVTAQLKTLS